MKRYHTPLIFMATFLGNIPVSYALENGAAVGIPSAGTVVVAAMESVGYHAQNQILTGLNDMMGELGGLIYLGVIVSAVITMGLMGRYQAVLWLLIGPPLFIYASGVELGGQKNRISAKGPDWQMGAFKGPEGVKEEVMRRPDTPTDVSFLFHKYNELISEVYQLLINKITSEDARKPILFMARQRVVEDLFSFDLTTPGGKELGAFFFAHCSNYISYAKILGTGKNDSNYQNTSIYKNAKEQYCKGFNVNEINLGNESIVLADYAKNLEPPYQTGQAVSCLQLWNWFRQTATRDFASQAEATENNVVGIERTTIAGAEVARKMWDDVLDKITKEKQAQGDADPCPFPSDSATFALENGDLPASLRVLANIYSALLIRKNNTVDANASAYTSILGGDMSGVYPSSDGSSKRHVVSLQGRESVIRSANAKVLGVSKQFEAFSLLMLIPYFQGMILYALSVTYPFFALTILIPGQAGSFFNWLALWAWAKSWDVGFAMIMVVDQLLWEILPKSTFFETNAIGEYTPVDLLDMHYSGDYSYSISMYWLIVSALIGAVPIVTAEAILGSKKAVAGAIMGGFSDIGGRMSKAVEDYTSTNAVRAIVTARTQQEIENSKANANGAVEGLSNMDNKVKQSEARTSDATDASKVAGQNMLDVGKRAIDKLMNNQTDPNSPNPGERDNNLRGDGVRLRKNDGTHGPDKPDK